MVTFFSALGVRFHHVQVQMHISSVADPARKATFQLLQR